MDLFAHRLYSTNNYTITALYNIILKTTENFNIDLMFHYKEFLCYLIEDEFRNIKVYGETRIPKGVYTIKLRTTGKLHYKYQSRFPQMHKGMLHITNVPNFEYIMVHTGVTEKDTDGCPLTALGTVNGEAVPGTSTKAYQKIYPLITQKLLSAEEVRIIFDDFDQEEFNLENYL